MGEKRTSVSLANKWYLELFSVISIAGFVCSEYIALSLCSLKKN